jgi:hypothetical protein
MIAQLLRHLYVDLIIARERFRQNQDQRPGFAEDALAAINLIAVSKFSTHHEATGMLSLYTHNLTLRGWEAVVDLVERTLELAA